MSDPIQDNLVLNWDRISTAKLVEAAKRNLRSSLPTTSGAPLSVTQKPSAPPRGTLHDYWSIGPYWWPDPAKPDGLPYIRRDGVHNPDYDSPRFDRIRLEHFSRDVLKSAIVGVTLNDSESVGRAIGMLHAWFIDPSTRMNPDFRYAQSIPGVCSGRGIGLIESRRLIDVAEATLILRRAGAIDDGDWSSIIEWYRHFLSWMLTHQYGIDERNEHNNHGTWCDAQIAAFALFTGEPLIAREVIADVGTRRLNKHLAPDGSQPHELSRTRSFTYSCFNLEGFFALAWLGRHVGIDLWSYRTPGGASLQTAIDFLSPYIDRSRVWPFPELPTPADEPDARQRLYPLLLQSAIAFDNTDYARQAERCHPANAAFINACWPVDEG